MMKAYMDTAQSPQARASLLLAEMSISEKMAQLVCFMPTALGDYAALKADYPQGAGEISCLQMRQLDTLEEAALLQRQVQEIVMALSPHRIPAIFHMEGLCGAYVQGATSLPSGIGRASTWNPALEERLGRIVGRQERAVGITHTLAPVLDISRDARMGRQGETYGEDPVLAAAMGVAFTKGLQAEATGALRTEAVAKHFLGFHAGQGGIHGADCDISYRQLREVYAAPFQAAITEAGLRGIMPCYNAINGQPVSGDGGMLTALLREEMGFDGVTVSDYGAIANIHTVHKVCEDLPQAGLRAMSAGLDMELHYKVCYGDQLAAWFEAGRADMTILDTAVHRVLTAKFRMGLFEQPFGLEGRALTSAFFDMGDRALTLQAAQESLVLLKNDGLLPLDRRVKRIAVIGCHADTARTMYGGYTHFSMAEGMKAAMSTMAGLQTAKGAERYQMRTIPGTPIQEDSPIFEAIMQKQNPAARSLLAQLTDSLPAAQITYAYGYPIAGDDVSGHEAALAAARDAEVVILTLGGKHGTSSIASMGEGVDATDINLPPCQALFIQKLAKLGTPFVAVHFNGRAISSDGAQAHAGAILEAWNPAEAGAEAIVSALLGDYNPGGKLPVSVAYTAGQIPIYYNHLNGSSYHQGESVGFADYVDCPHTPRYCFGHGLSYTDFTYEGLVLREREVAPDGQVTATVTVTNTGRCAGDEVVQLYVRDRLASMVRPALALVGFARVHLAAGETRMITFTLSMSQLAFIDAQGRWKVEAGAFELLVGSSSEDIRLRDGFTILADAYVEPAKRGFYAGVR